MIEAFRDDLYSGMPLDDALVKHNLSLKKALKIAGLHRGAIPKPKFKKPKPKVEKPKPKIHRRSVRMNKRIPCERIVWIRPTWINKGKSGNYYVKVSMNAKEYYLGTFCSKEDSIAIIREMIRRDMDMEQLDDAIKTLGVERPPRTAPSYIYPRMARKRTYYEIKKTRKGQTTHFGVYKSLSVAEKVVEDLKKVNWNKKHLKEIRNKHEHREEAKKV